MVHAGIKATSGIHSKLQEMQRVFENDDEAVPIAIVEVIEPTREGAKAIRK